MRTNATVSELSDRVDAAVAVHKTFTVHNKGFERVGDAYVYNVHEDGRGSPTQPFVDLASALRTAVLPLSIPVNDYLVPPLADVAFWGHLTLASHDLLVDGTLAD